MNLSDDTHLSERWRQLLSRAENLIYIGAALTLVAGGLILLGFSIYEFAVSLGTDLTRQISRLLDNLLLVLMLVEILHTIGIFLKKRKLVIEPFLAVGIIAAIRRVLIITAEQVHPSVEHAAVFRMTMLELGLLTGMILALVISIFFLRRHGRDDPLDMDQ